MRNDKQSKEEIRKDYWQQCDAGSIAGDRFFDRLVAEINKPGYDGLARHWLADTLLGETASANQISLCYQIIRRFENLCQK